MKDFPQKEALEDIIKSMMSLELDRVKGFKKKKQVLDIKEEESEEEEYED